MMKRSHILVALALALGALASGLPAAAQGRDDGRRWDGDRGEDRDGDRERRPGGWDLLGSSRVGFAFKRETVVVGREAGRIDNIRLRARGNDIFIDELRVVFGNGEAQEIDAGERLPEGSETRPIALARGGRFVERIEIVARERPSLRRRGVIEIYGEARSGGGQPEDGWELIGSHTAGFTFDREIVEIERRGDYEKIRLRARGDDIYIKGFRAVYANGEDEDFKVSSKLREGETTQAVELDDNAGPLRRIEIVARAKPSFRRRAVVEVFGEKRRGRPEANWEELGCQKVGFLADRDVIRVGRGEGRFRAIQLRVTGNEVALLDLSVIYGNGEADDYRVYARIPEGGRTPPINLRGNRRAIDRIIMVYRAQPNFRGSARVCAYGLE